LVFSSGVVTLQSRFTHPDAALLHMLRAGEWFGTVPVLARDGVDASPPPRELTCEAPAAFRATSCKHCFDVTRSGLPSSDVTRFTTWTSPLQGAVDLLIRDASARCAAVLLRLAGRRWALGPDAGMPSEIPASQSEIAMLCNVSRNTFSRVMREFTSIGLVTLGYRSLTVNDPAGLRAIADGG
jgi:CRP/FNR family transcriptional regulator, cyclic AMP receptor protein